MKKLALVSLLLNVGVLLAACAPAAAPILPPTPAPSPTSAMQEAEARLRIENAGEHDLIGLVVRFPDSRIVFGDVPAGTTSAYQPAPQGVYNYAAYEYRQDGELKTQPVMDWMGESPRPGQSYTYVLDYDPQRENMLAIELVEVRADLN